MEHLTVCDANYTTRVLLVQNILLLCSNNWIACELITFSAVIQHMKTQDFGEKSIASDFPISVSVSVSVTFVHDFRIFAKNKLKKYLHRFCCSPLHDAIEKAILHDLNFNTQSPNFLTLTSRKRCKLAQKYRVQLL